MLKMTFPVIAIKGSAIELKESIENLGTCTKRALKPGGWFDAGGPKVIDAHGFEYRIRSARYARNAGRKAFPGLFAPALVEVDLELEAAGQRSVEEVRDALANAIRHDPEVWAGATGSVDSILNALKDANSINDLWKVMIPLLTPTQS